MFINNKNHNKQLTSVETISNLLLTTNAPIRKLPPNDWNLSVTHPHKEDILSFEVRGNSGTDTENTATQK